MPVKRREGGKAGINYKCYKTTTHWYFSGYDFPPKNNWYSTKLLRTYMIEKVHCYLLIFQNWRLW